MRRTATVLTLIFVLTTAAFAACPDAPAGATYVGTQTVSTGGSQRMGATESAPKKGTYTGEICIFRTADGKTIYMVDKSSVRKSDGAGSYSTSEDMSDAEMEKAVQKLLKAAQGEKDDDSDFR